MSEAQAPPRSEPGSTLEATVERVVPGGDGLARVEGQVLLVEGALPGDRVRVQVVEAGKRLLRGRLLDVLERSPDRRDDAEVCPRAVDRSCGGCDWPAARIDSHRALKTALVVDALRRIGRVDDVPALGWRGSPRRYRLRNRLHLDALGRLGFYGPGTNDVAPLAETCEVVSERFRARLGGLLEALVGSGVAGELLTLEGLDGSPLLVELRTDEPPPDAGALVQRLSREADGARIVAGGRVVASSGPSSLALTARGASFTVSVSSFFQGNRYLLDSFLEEVSLAVAGCGPVKTAWDLYAGAGFLTRPLLEAGARPTAVEIEPSSFADLRVNLDRWRRDGLREARAFASTAEAFLRNERGTADLVVADPPRAGMSPHVRAELLRRRPRHLLLVSCDPATLARDVASLSRSYRIERGTLLDLFPGTHHVETLLLLRASPPR